MTRLAAILLLAAACLAEAGNSLRYSPATAGDAGAGRGPGILLAVENGLKPWPSGHGETPPPLGSLVSLVPSGPEPNATATRRVIATNLVDPVWVVGAPEHAYVGLFHPGKVVRVSLINGDVETVAEGLSCPEGVALDNRGGGFLLYVNENPVGDECKAPFPRKKAAQLTRIDLRTGAQAKVAGLRSSTGGEEGGPHGLAVGSNEGDFAYVCDCPSEGAALVRVALASGTKTIAANLTSPSGCAVSGNFAYIVEQGGTDGQLVSVRLADGKKDILLDNLAGPMGVATDGNYVYVEERHKNRVRRVNLSNGNAEVFATGLNSPIGLGIAYGY